MGGFDDRVASFQRMGLSEAAARIAAVGRGGHEADVRRELDGDPQAAPLGESAGAGVVVSQAAVTPQLAEAIAEVTTAAKDAFGKTDEQARTFALQLAERALTRGGDQASAAAHMGTVTIALREVYRPGGVR